jgi:hypothetical protein
MRDPAVWQSDFRLTYERGGRLSHPAGTPRHAPDREVIGAARRENPPKY